MAEHILEHISQHITQHETRNTTPNSSLSLSFSFQTMPSTHNQLVNFPKGCNTTGYHCHESPETFSERVDYTLLTMIMPSIKHTWSKLPAMTRKCQKNLLKWLWEMQSWCFEKLLLPDPQHFPPLNLSMLTIELNSSYHFFQKQEFPWWTGILFLYCISICRNSTILPCYVKTILNNIYWNPWHTRSCSSSLCHLCISMMVWNVISLFGGPSFCAACIASTLLQCIHLAVPCTDLFLYCWKACCRGDYRK